MSHGKAKVQFNSLQLLFFQRAKCLEKLLDCKDRGLSSKQSEETLREERPQA